MRPRPAAGPIFPGSPPLLMGNENSPSPLPSAGDLSPVGGEVSLAKQLGRARTENAVLRRSLLALQASQKPTGDAHRAALNLLEDAVIARQQADALNGQLREEIERRQEIQQALLGSEERVRLALDAAAMGSFIWHVEEDRAEADVRMGALLGVPPGHAISLQEALATLIHPDDRERYAAAVALALDPAGPGILKEDVRVRRPDSGWNWLAVNGQVYFEGEPRRAVRMAGAALDITPRKHTEETLRVSEERFRVALEAAEMAAWDYSVARDRVVWNAQHYRLFGLEPREGELDSADFLRAVHPEDLAHVTERLREAVEQTGIYRADFRIIRADNGEVRWMSGFGRAMSWGDGHATRMTGVMFEITERHRIEENLAATQESLRLIVESALEHAIVSMDMERRVTSWNRGAEVIHGYTKEEMLGQPADLMFMPEDRAAGVPDREQATALAKGHADDNRWMHRKGGRFWANGAMLPMRTRTDGEVIGFVKILRDQTESQRAREALEAALYETEQARAEVEAAGRAKDQFLAVLSHELRTPLTPVLMATRGLARRADLPAPVREGLRMIQRNIELEARFVDDLLDVTRISRGKLELMREPMDVHEAIAEAAEICRPDFDAKEQRITVQLEATEHRIHGDAARVKQVVWNLLKNASKFTPRGGEVRVHTCNPKDNPRVMLMEVRDTGIGIAAEALPKIFDAFTQAGAEIAREFGGLGLGLAIARATVLGHGGEMSADSAGPGKGATFTVSLPLEEKGKDGDEPRGS